MFGEKIIREFEADHVVMESEILRWINDYRADAYLWFRRLAHKDDFEDGEFEMHKNMLIGEIDGFYKLLNGLCIISDGTYDELSEEAMTYINRIAEIYEKRQKGENENGKQ